MKIKTLSLLLSATCMVAFSLMDMSCSSSGDDPSGPDCSTLNVTIPLANITAPTGCNTNDGQIIAVGSGGSESYQYKIGSGAYQSSATFTNLAPGTYLITVKDSKGCEKVSANAVVANTGSTLAAESDVELDTECLTGNGKIIISADGGTAPYQYKLGAGVFGDNAVFTNLESGTYSITVKDAENCSIVVNANVTKGASGLTYTTDIKPILQAKCQFDGCHPNNGDWFTYSTAKANASAIKTRTGNGSMPKSPQPGGALSADQIKMIACWVDDGAPQ